MPEEKSALPKWLAYAVIIATAIVLITSCKDNHANLFELQGDLNKRKFDLLKSMYSSVENQGANYIFTTVEDSVNYNRKLDSIFKYYEPLIADVGRKLDSIKRVME